MPERPPVFVLGCPRSGTTFLSSLLRATGWGAPFESQFIVKYYRDLPSYQPLDTYENFASLLEAVLKEPAMRQRRVAIDAVAAFSALDRKNYRSLVDLVCFHISRHRDERVVSWGDKTPAYTLESEILEELFPDARFIYLTRDGRDVALSLMQKPWGPANVYSCAQLWKRHIARKQALRHLEAAGRLLFVRYEDLLRDPEEGIVELYRYLGGPCPPGDLQRLAGTARRSNYDKWKKLMSARDRQVFESVAAGALRAEGYEVEHEEGPLSPAAVAWYAAGDRLKVARHLARVNLAHPVLRAVGREPSPD